jgi:hypothetical protein
MVKLPGVRRGLSLIHELSVGVGQVVVIQSAGGAGRVRVVESAGLVGIVESAWGSFHLACQRPASPAGYEHGDRSRNNKSSPHVSSLFILLFIFESLDS